MKIYVLSFGKLFIPQAALYGDDFPSDKKVAAPMYGVLIDHPDGKILFDTGFVLDGGLEKLYQHTIEFSEEDIIDNRLKSIGLSPEDINYVVISHLHADHCGNIHKFKNAEILVNKEDFVNVMANYGLNKLEWLTNDYIELWARNKPRWRLIEDSKVELLKDVTLYTFGLGHTYGMSMLKVKTEKSGTIITASDLIYSKELLNKHKLPGVYLDEPGYFASLAQLKEMAQKEIAAIWFGHDIEQFNTLKQAPSFYE
jgi:glyoxylase-like metal-dependent hydrolase (beta-lactamase superfamily II)